jgi:hypothetical protein
LASPAREARRACQTQVEGVEQFNLAAEDLVLLSVCTSDVWAALPVSEIESCSVIAIEPATSAV